MPTYAITGGLGSGKSLISVGRIQDYLRQGRPVATNLNIHLKDLLHVRSKQSIIRLPDFPSREDFDAIGCGNESVDESKNGLLVLDECGVFFNSREWGDKGRQAAIAWLLHSRKKGWDVIFIVQSIELIDKQIRVSLIEHLGICKRLDRFKIPFVGWLLDAFGLPARPPKLHICSLKYGIGQHAMVVDRWVYRGNTLYRGYDTRQIFNKETSPALHTVLSPYYTEGRFLPPQIQLKDLPVLAIQLCLFIVCKLMNEKPPIRRIKTVITTPKIETLRVFPIGA